MSIEPAETLWGYIFISPWLIGFIVFTLGPMIASLVLSLTRYNITSPPVFIRLGELYQALYRATPDLAFAGHHCEICPDCHSAESRIWLCPGTAPQSECPRGCILAYSLLFAIGDRRRGRRDLVESDFQSTIRDPELASQPGRHRWSGLACQPGLGRAGSDHYEFVERRRRDDYLPFRLAEHSNRLV